MLKRYFNSFMTIVVLVLLGNCSTTVATKIPDWVSSYQHPKYPADRFFLGVGISDDKTVATELARADVAKQIRVRIESELNTMESEIRQDARIRNFSEVTSLTKSVADETIAGMEIAESVQLQGQFYVLAVLNKARYLEGLGVEMDRILQETDQLLQAARKAAGEGGLFTAIRNYADAQGKIPEYYARSALYTALSGERYPNPSRTTTAGIEGELREMLSRVELKMLSGNQQQARAGRVLDAPLVVKAVQHTEKGEEVGIRQFPLRARYENGETIAAKETGLDGIAAFPVTATPTDGIGNSGAVKIGLNLEKLPKSLMGVIPKSEIMFYYTLEKEDITFTVNIVDKSGSQFTDVEKMVSALISENGYTVAAAAALVIEGNLAVTRDQEIESPAGKQFYVESAVSLRLVDKPTGNILATAKGKGKGLDSVSRPEAVRKAYENIRFSKQEFAAFLQSAKNR